jgi:hypothetical protein
MLWRMVPWEASTATFCISRPVTAAPKSATLKSLAGSSAPLTGAKYRFRYPAVAAFAPIHDCPSWPATSVVTPWASAPSTRPPASSGPSACTCASMNPGHTTLPGARPISAHSPGDTSTWPTAAITGPSISTSARCTVVPMPSATSPPRSSMREFTG